MNIFLHELKSLRKTTIIWTISLVALLALYLSIYPGMAKDAEDFKTLLGNYPEPVRAILGIDLDNITSILGFYSMIFSFIVVFGAVQAMNLGVSILSRESRERTADFLLVKPVSRTTIVTAKLLAAFTDIVITNVIFLAVSFIMANAVKTADFDLKAFFLINLTLFFIQVMFLAIGMICSVFFKKLKNILPLSLGVVFGLYMIGALIATGKDVDATRYISPFRYFDIHYIMKNSSYEFSYMITGIAIVVISIIVSYIVYNKKDIHAV